MMVDLSRIYGDSQSFFSSREERLNPNRTGAVRQVRHYIGNVCETRTGSSWVSNGARAVIVATSSLCIVEIRRSNGINFTVHNKRTYNSVPSIKRRPASVAADERVVIREHVSIFVYSSALRTNVRKPKHVFNVVWTADVMRNRRPKTVSPIYLRGGDTHCKRLHRYVV